MSADKSINKDDLPMPEKKPKIMQPEEYIQKQGNLGKDKSDESPMPGGPPSDDQPSNRE